MQAGVNYSPNMSEKQNTFEAEEEAIKTDTKNNKKR